MKKIIACILIFTMAFVTCACGNQPTTSNNEIKFGLICLHDENSPYDNNFITAFKEACENAEVDYLIKTNIDESNNCYEAAAELIDDGCNIIFADSFGHEDFIIQAAKDFPNVQFCHATGTKAHTENLINYHNAFASIYQGRYIGGIVAGLKLKEMINNKQITLDQAKIGYVGAFTYAEVISGYSSFYLGVKKIVPEAVMEVTFTGSWFDETFEKEAANTLINNGCVIISSHADSMGVPSACAAAGIPFVFYNNSIEDIYPNTFMVSTRINWEPYFSYVINCVRNNIVIDTDWVGTLETGSVVVSDVNEKVAPIGTSDVIKEVIQELNNKTLNIFNTNTFTVNGAVVNTYMADVNTDPNYSPDTETICNGVFYESAYRSAPYFDLQIDGIVLLNTSY